MFHSLLFYKLCASLTIGPESFPTNFETVLVDSHSMKLSWGSPAKPNGVIINYRISCSGCGQQITRIVPGSRNTSTLTGLLSYITYSCSIIAYTSVGGGPVATIAVTMDQDSELPYHNDH